MAQVPLDVLNKLLEQQQEMFRQFTEIMTQQKSTEGVNDRKEFLIQSLSNRITEFVYDPENNLTFTSWYSRYEDIISIDGKDLDNESRTRLLVSKLNAVAYQEYVNHILPRKTKDVCLEDTIKELTILFDIKQSINNIRYQCLKMVKDPLDDITRYAGKVNLQCEKFKLNELTPDQFKVLIFVFGLQDVRDTDVRTRILAKMDVTPDITLKDAVNECERYYALKADTRLVEKSSEQAHSLYQKKSSKKKIMVDKTHSAVEPNKIKCKVCGKEHRQPCRYKDYTCEVCGKKGHLKKVCYHRNKNYHKNCHKLDKNIQKPKMGRKYMTIKIKDHPIKMQMDTGSDITTISLKLWSTIGKPPLMDVQNIVTAANGEPFKLYGYFNCDFSHDGYTGNGCCYVSEQLCLMGLDWMEQLKPFNQFFQVVCNRVESSNKQVTNKEIPVSRIEKLKSKFPDIFGTGLGKCSKTKAVLVLEKGSQPVFIKKRPVPFSAMETIDKELDRLEQLGVITAVDYSQWAAPIVVVKKANGTTRVCADFSTGLNDALMMHQHPIKSPEEIFVTLNGGKIFSQIDFSDAYLQIEVDEDSKHLLTINTHRGLYQYNRLPFGVKSAPGIYQQVMDTMLAGLTGTAAYLDDIIVVGSNETDHQKNLEQVLKRISEYGFKIRLDKCSFHMSQIKYLGNIIDKYGRRPDPAKIEAIKKMPKPKDQTDLRAFLGLINYYGNFVSNMRKIRAPFDELLKKDAKWFWSQACETSFQEAKKILSSDLLLTHYNPELDVTVAADASSYGLGAVILHRFPDGAEKAIAHASRTLTKTEKGYSQIEKEGLALIFAVKKFHTYIFGKSFTLLTDHKPLLAIFGNKKGIPIHTANRLLRWATILVGYNFKIEYKSTNNFGLVDALSRLIANTPGTNEDIVIAKIESDVVESLHDSIRALPITYRDVAKESKTDRTLQEVLKCLRNNSWPNEKSEELQQFFNRRDTLSVVEDCLMFANRVVIPKTLRRQVLRQVHSGHPGIVRMKMLMRQYAYWPNVDKDVESFVKTCQRCSLASKLPRKTTLQSWQEETKPWVRIHLDFAGPFNGKMYLVIVDAYSKWPEIVEMDRITSTATIEVLMKLISQFGIPELIVSDNGTQFTSSQFQNFCTMNGIKHIRSPPFHPQSNGQAERFVDTFKRGMLKLQGQGNDRELLQMFLGTYRITPSGNHDDKSPAELFLGRKIRNKCDLLLPQKKLKVAARQSTRMEGMFNKHHGAREHKFKINDLVYARDYRNSKASWVPGTIAKPIGKVLFEIKVGNKIWIRHANQILPRSNSSFNELIDVFNLPSDYLNHEKESSEQDQVMSGDTPQEITQVDQDQIITDDSPQESTEVEAMATVNPRRSTRVRHKPPKLLLNPNSRSYI